MTKQQGGRGKKVPYEARVLIREAKSAKTATRNLVNF